MRSLVTYGSGVYSQNEKLLPKGRHLASVTRPNRREQKSIDAHSDLAAAPSKSDVPRTTSLVKMVFSLFVGFKRAHSSDTSYRRL